MSPAGRTPLSGTAYELQHGRYGASIAGVGATLRRLTHTGRDLVLPFDADEVRPAFRGATLAPWPNRVVDGRYVFDSRLQQLALTERERAVVLLSMRRAGDPGGCLRSHQLGFEKSSGSTAEDPGKGC